MDWFLYDRDLRHERVNIPLKVTSAKKMITSQNMSSEVQVNNFFIS